MPEGQYMFKNIERKQRAIDEKQHFKMNKEKKFQEREEKKNKYGGFSDLLNSEESLDRFFDTRFVDSVHKVTPQSLLDISQDENTLRKHSLLDEHKMNSSTISEHSNIHKGDNISNWDKFQEICNQSGFLETRDEKPLDQIVSEFIEKDSEILSDYDLNNSINLKENNRSEEKKIKVKRVDYTLKITSNDIERSNPKRDNRYRNPMNYKIQPKRESSTHSSKNSINKGIRKKTLSQQKRLNEKDIFGTNDRKIINTQRYDKVNYNSSKYSPMKSLHQSKSTAVMASNKKTSSSNKNFQVISQKESYQTLNKQPISNMKSDKLTSANYKTGSINEKLKGHHRVETWNGSNQLLGRKTSHAISQSRQSLQNSTSNKASKGYQAYLTSKRTTNHIRKKTTAASSEQDKNHLLTGSKSACKLIGSGRKQDTGFETVTKDSRLSLNSLAPETKYLTKPQNRNTFDKSSNISKSALSKKLSTPKNASKEPSYKTSGVLTARTVHTESVQTIDKVIQKSERKIPRKDYSDKNSLEVRNPRIFAKKLRTKSRGEFIQTKESSSNSSKVSNKCQSSISKSNSRTKDKVASTKHQKKKSAAVPTRSTTALYSNKSEYEKKRNSKAIISAMKPSVSAATLESRLSTNLQNKFDSSIKYPLFDKELKDSSYHQKRESYNVIKSSRDNRRLIEFKLHDDESSENIPKAELFKDPQESKSSLYQAKFNENKLHSIRKMYSYKSEQKLDILKPKLGKASITHNHKPKNPSI